MQSNKREIPKPQFKSDRIDEALHRLHLAVEGIKASVVVNRDGLLVAAYPPGDNDSIISPTSIPQVAAMSATLAGLAERTLDRLDQGDLERLMMEGEEGIMVVYPAGRAMLAVLVDKKAQMSRVLVGARKAAQDVAIVLDS